MNIIQRGLDGFTGESLECVNKYSDQNHVYVGMDIHGNSRCSCGELFLTAKLADAWRKGQAKLHQYPANIKLIKENIK